MSPEKQSILTEIFRAFSQSLQANFSLINQVIAAPCHIFPITYSPLSCMTLQALQSELLTLSLISDRQERNFSSGR